MADKNTIIDANEFKNERILLFSREDSFIYFDLKKNQINKVAREKKNEYVPGDIIVARVNKKNDAIGAYFCNIDKNTEVFLPYDECFLSKCNKKEKLKQGDQIIVQIKKAAYDNKKALVSCRIELSNEYIVVKRGFQEKPVSFSKKINRNKKAEMLDSLATVSEELCSLELNILIRSKAVDCDITMLLDSIYDSEIKMETLINRGKHGALYTILKKSDSFLKIHLDNMKPSERESLLIVAEDKEAFDYGIGVLTEAGYSGSLMKLHNDDNITLQALYGLRKKFLRISREKVMLGSGAYLFITPTPALVAIDVNMGKFDKTNDREKAILKVNIEAAKEIAYQIAARNLSGIIIVDFINLMDKDNITILINYMNKLFSDMKPTPKLVDITKLGLAEITVEKKNDNIYGIISYVNDTILM